MIVARLGSAKFQVQVDVGFGDAVTPEPKQIELPRLLADEACLTMHGYTPETVIAEKLEAIVKLGLANSRMKDYLDLDLLLEEESLDQHIVATAIERTFRRRQTELPSELPLGLTESFWKDETANRRWQAFSRRNNLPARTLEDICESIGSRLLPIVETAFREKD